MFSHLPPPSPCPHNPFNRNLHQHHHHLHSEQMNQCCLSNAHNEAKQRPKVLVSGPRGVAFSICIGNQTPWGSSNFLGEPFPPPLPGSPNPGRGTPPPPLHTAWLRTPSLSCVPPSQRDSPKFWDCSAHPLNVCTHENAAPLSWPRMGMKVYRAGMQRPMAIAESKPEASNYVVEAFCGSKSFVGAVWRLQQHYFLAYVGS